MSILEFGILLLIAAVCGSIGQALAGSSRGGCLASVALGFIGALFGAWLSRALGLPELLVVQVDSTGFPILWSIIGSAVFVAVLSLIAGPQRRRG